ncbi:hypothetical protein GCM10020219_015880 [Nonomuraea dietziae]
MVAGDGPLGQRLQDQSVLPGLGRADDESALTLADGRDLGQTTLVVSESVSMFSRSRGWTGVRSAKCGPVAPPPTRCDPFDFDLRFVDELRAGTGDTQLAAGSAGDELP